MRLDPWIRDHAALGALVGVGAPGAFFAVTATTGEVGLGYHHPALYLLCSGLAGTLLGAAWGAVQAAITRVRPDGLGWAAILLCAPAAGFVWGFGAGVAPFPTAVDWMAGPSWYSPDGAFVMLGAMLAATIGSIVALSLAIIYVPIRMTGGPAWVLMVPATAIGAAAGPVGVAAVMAVLFGIS